MKDQRNIKAWGLLAGAALVAASCTPGGGDEGDGELTWAVGGAEAQPGGVHQQVAELWNTQNPDNPVTIEVLPESADEQREQQALELQAEGSGFDILSMDVIWTGEYSENGWLESLEDLRGDIEDVVLAGPLESAIWGGELWGVPHNSNVGFLYYRTDLVDSPPTTWDELCQVGAQVGAAEGISGFVGQGARYEGFTVNWLEYYWSAGGELFNEDQSEVVFDVDLAVEVTEFMADAVGSCYAPGFNTAMEEEARNEFQEGNAVFMRNWPYAVSLIDEDTGSPANGNYGIAPLPTFTGDGTISALGGFNLGVSAFSENTDLAKEFVLWAGTDPEAQAITGQGPPPVLASVYEEFADDPVLTLIGQVLAEAKARPPAPFYNELSVELQRALFDAYNGQADPREAAEQVQTFLEDALN